MDLVKIIKQAVDALPDGEYRPGLRAIQRHISVAIRHFEREDNGELDSFTDAIYRCNQAYEGALKEAYRVLAGKDPSRQTPHKIEEYLEKNQTVRPRALKQLSRYREDYRNPSVHDYKLDFDEDEALLAITAVCAFTKLLTNQIAAKVAFDTGKSAAKKSKIGKTNDADEFHRVVSGIIVQAMNSAELRNLAHFEQLQYFIFGVLESSGYDVELRSEDDLEYDPENIRWNTLVRDGAFILAIEVRTSPHCDLKRSRDWIEEQFGEEEVRHVILVVSDHSKHSGFEVLNVPSKGGALKMIHPQDGLDREVSQSEFEKYQQIKDDALAAKQ